MNFFKLPHSVLVISTSPLLPILLQLVYMQSSLCIFLLEHVQYVQKYNPVCFVNELNCSLNHSH
jgi:hypothetical protein